MTTSSTSRNAGRTASSMVAEWFDLLQSLDFDIVCVQILDRALDCADAAVLYELAPSSGARRLGLRSRQPIAVRDVLGISDVKVADALRIRESLVKRAALRLHGDEAAGWDAAVDPGIPIEIVDVIPLGELDHPGYALGLLHAEHRDIECTRAFGTVAALALSNARRHKLAVSQGEQTAGLLAVVSHSIGSTLTAVRLAAGALERLDPAAVGTAAPEYLKTIHEAADELDALLGDVRMIRRLRDRGEPLRRESVSTGRLMAAAAEKAHSAAEYRGIRLIVDAVDPGHVEVDRETVERALIRLLARSIGSSPRGSTVRVRGEANDTSITITVEDSGSGADGMNVGTLVDRYDAGGGIDSAELELVRVVAWRHGGEVRASGEPGKGSSWALTLPASGG